MESDSTRPYENAVFENGVLHAIIVPSEGWMSHIFISYSKKNKDYTDKLVAYLENAGFNVWYDGRIDYGTSWERVIFKAIDDCAVFLVVMSPESYDSDWVRKEYLYADKRKKPQFPILLDGEEFPFYVDNQYTDVRGAILPPQSFLTRLESVLTPQKDSGKNVALKETAKPTTFKLPEPFEWVQIPAGKVNRYGTFDVPTFAIAKYPVTVAQYTLFIEDKGYAVREFWTQAGWEWKQKEKITLPRYWGEDKYEHFFKPLHPIIGVSWYESMAFCAWLSEKSGDKITLPTEQQWQRAAQGDDGRTYPWGNDFDVERCNNSVKAKSIGTTPVTQYPNGASPYGVLDMSGNVWEWMLNEFGIINIDNINIPETHVTQGGSWFDSHELSFRANVGSWNDPIPGGNRLGFRLARA